MKYGFGMSTKKTKKSSYCEFVQSDHFCTLLPDLIMDDTCFQCGNPLYKKLKITGLCYKCLCLLDERDKREVFYLTESKQIKITIIKVPPSLLRPLYRIGNKIVPCTQMYGRKLSIKQIANLKNLT